MNDITRDVLCEILTWAGIEGLSATGVSNTWRNAGKLAFAEELAWIDKEKEVISSTLEEDQRPLHLFVETEGRFQGEGSLAVQKGADTVQILNPDNTSELRIPQSCLWYSVSCRRFLYIDWVDRPGFFVTTIPNGSRKTLLEELDPVREDETLFAAHHTHTGGVFLRVDSRITCILNNRTTVYNYSPPAMLLWKELETCCYVSATSTIIIMGESCCVEMDVSDPLALVQLPSLHYGATPDGAVVLRTRNSSLQHSILYKKGEVFASLTPDRLRAIHQAPPTTSFFFEDIVLSSSTVAVLVTPLGPVPPASIALFSLRHAVFLTCIPFASLDIPTPALSQQGYAIKLARFQGRPSVTVLLPSELGTCFITIATRSS
eukprot:TRINITY_DN19026_c0_g1_i2.p1 TRINITY_DN19026_c0_g1~~TRINITY_DN19026_c0_g1_i2.p1  ORF type:complete len:375 (+),score=41.61 TRINITY_DN19026_c0_g1_i2:29-1153(+)